jgi:soluble lytic murein transglycosylase-like protein
MARLIRLLRFPILSMVAVSTLALGTQPALARSAAPLSHQQARRILVAAARHHNLNPNFVLAVAWWESGWNQNAVSRTGAVGLMQIEPYTAAWAGPRYLHRRANLRNPVDNAELGAALLRDYLDRLHDPRLALAAYYQGLRGVQLHGIYPSSRPYVDGIWKLRNRFQAGHYPA